MYQSLHSSELQLRLQSSKILWTKLTSFPVQTEIVQKIELNT